MADSLTWWLRAVRREPPAEEPSAAAPRLGSYVESRAAWVGDTAEGAVRRVEDAMLGRGGAPAGPKPAADLHDRLWSQVMGAIGPELRRVEDRARAVRDDPNSAPSAAVLARDVDWLIGELQAAWAREVALRARRPSDG